MTIAAPSPAPSSFEHLLLDDVSWDFYEQLLREIGDRPLRVTYDNGQLKIMSPLRKHELWGEWIAWLIQLMCVERSILLAPLGSTTFRNKLKKKGLEPDKCFYIQHYDDVRDMEDEFDPSIHPAPDLAIEIDITSRSVAREPIYAALGVTELWRFDGQKLWTFHLVDGKYANASDSLAFPFLQMAEFIRYVLRRRERDQHKVLSEFREWVKTLK